MFFLAGFLFIIGGFEKTGILKTLSQQLFQTAGGRPLKATLLTIWSSGLASAIVSNIAIALTFIPIIHELGGSSSMALWSALVLGTNLGGAATPLSGTVCIMAIGALKQEGLTLSFGEFSKVGTLTTLVQLGFATLYLILRFGLGA